MAPNAYKFQLVHPRAYLTAVTEELSLLQGTALNADQLCGIPHLGLVILSDRSPDKLCSLFLQHVAHKSRSRTGDTVRAYGESLAAWLSYLNKVSVQPSDVTEPVMQGYRDAFYRDGGRRCSAATVVLRVGTALRFTRWVHIKGLCESPLGRQLAVLEAESGYWRRPRSPLSPFISLPRVRARLPVALNANDAGDICKMVGSPYDLIIKWALCTGLRRFEICELKFEHIPYFASTGATSGLHEIRITRKGGALHSAYVPAALILETFWHVTLNRPHPVHGSEDYIFLNRCGKRVTRAAVSQQFRRAADAVGVQSTFHHLRHTFALSVLSLLEAAVRRGAEINPIKVLQILLGHASVDSTETYLQAYEVVSPHVEKALCFLYGLGNVGNIGPQDPDDEPENV
ncbi:tyrosine-type recombinase/integrase [Cupriavidus pauculus]|uniref:tyrosine-type recombinase/integrase n=1 Tax=Cupriavidus pauculus TaxID=82633 RepID=UPI0009FE27DE